MSSTARLSSGFSVYSCLDSCSLWFFQNMYSPINKSFSRLASVMVMIHNLDFKSCTINFTKSLLIPVSTSLKTLPSLTSPAPPSLMSPKPIPPHLSGPYSPLSPPGVQSQSPPLQNPTPPLRRFRFSSASCHPIERSPTVILSRYGPLRSSPFRSARL